MFDTGKQALRVVDGEDATVAYEGGAPGRKQGVLWMMTHQERGHVFRAAKRVQECEHHLPIQ